MLPTWRWQRSPKAASDGKRAFEHRKKPTDKEGRDSLRGKVTGQMRQIGVSWLWFI